MVSAFTILTLGSTFKYLGVLGGEPGQQHSKAASTGQNRRSETPQARGSPAQFFQIRKRTVKRTKKLTEVYFTEHPIQSLMVPGEFKDVFNRSSSKIGVAIVGPVHRRHAEALPDFWILQRTN